MSVEPNFLASQLIAEALRTELLIRTLIGEVRTLVPVRVLAVHPGGGSPPAIGTVDLQPLVQTVDGSGKLWSVVPQGKAVYGAPFSRIQSGGTAVVLDPVVDDIGLAAVCDRDISLVVASGGQLSAPGSARMHDLSDLVYLYSIISATAVTQYIWANADGISLLSPNTITIQGGQINLKGPVNQTGGEVTLETKVTVPNVDATTDVTVPNGSVNDHVHEVIEVGEPTGPMTG
jgi:hypothetical protein